MSANPTPGVAGTLSASTLDTREYTAADEGLRLLLERAVLRPIPSRRGHARPTCRSSAFRRASAGAIYNVVMALYRRHRRIAYGAALLAALVAAAVAFTRIDLSPLAAATPGWVVIALALNSSSLLLRAGALPSVAVPPGRVMQATMIGVNAQRWTSNSAGRSWPAPMSAEGISVRIRAQPPAHRLTAS